jgi:hypothetical protein
MKSYRLTREELLEYPGLNGMLAACHLRVYEAPTETPVCIVGNFDGGVGTTTTNAIEMVATAVSERIDADRFTLIEWYPHGYESWPFSEVRLRRARGAERKAGWTVIMNEAGEADLACSRRVRIRFANPQWRSCSEQRAAELLGAEALRELTELAGEDGEYQPRRALGEAEHERVEKLRRFNHERLHGIAGQLAEGGIR